jgi:hypothetical protein
MRRQSFSIRMRLARYLLPLALLFSSFQAQALLLELSPSTQGVALGDQATFDLFARSIGTDLVASFDVTLAFDSTLLALDEVLFGPSLGDPDPGSFESLVGVTTALGQVGVSQVSLLFDLSGLQDGSDLFLSRLTFDTLSLGLGSLGFLSASVSDALGFPIDPLFLGDSVNVTIEPARIPEPGTLLLLAAGLLVLRLSRTDLMSESMRSA